MQNSANTIEQNIPARSASATRRGPGKAKRLSDAALVLLSHAASRADGMVLPPPSALRARGSALAVLLANLLERGLIQEIPVESEGQSWRRDDVDGWIGLQISALGLSAIGVEVQPDDSQSQTDEPTVGFSAPELLDVGLVQGQPAGAPSAGAPLAGPAPKLASTEQPSRRISKQDQIVGLLGRAEGASLETLMATTDWLPHTIRAALSGLRKKGHVITHHKSETGAAVHVIELPAPTTDVVGSLS